MSIKYKAGDVVVVSKRVDDNIECSWNRWMDKAIGKSYTIAGVNEEFSCVYLKEFEHPLWGFPIDSVEVTALPRVTTLVEEFESFDCTQAQLIAALELALKEAKACGSCQLQLGDRHTIQIETGADSCLIVDYQLDIV